MKVNVDVRRILFPTDFSEPARHAQKYALALTERFAAELHLLHVIPPAPMPYPDVDVAWPIDQIDMAPIIDAAKKQLSREVDGNWRERHPTIESVDVGFAVDEIVSYAKDHDIDII